jgi:hypothetical protein
MQAMSVTAGFYPYAQFVVILAQLCGRPPKAEAMALSLFWPPDMILGRRPPRRSSQATAFKDEWGLA